VYKGTCVSRLLLYVISVNSVSPTAFSVIPQLSASSRTLQITTHRQVRPDLSIKRGLDDC